MLEADIVRLIQQLGAEETRQASAEALVQLGASAVEPLLVIIHKKRTTLSYHALEILSAIGDERAIPPLIELLANDNYLLAERVRETLVKIGAAAVEPLSALLSAGGVDARINAAFTLSLIKDVRAVEALCKALQDPAEDVRRWADHALNALGAPDTLPLLVLKDTRITVRQRYDSLLALSHLTVSTFWGKRPRFLTEGMEAFCERSLHHEEPDVRSHASELLAMLTLLRSGQKTHGSDHKELLRMMTAQSASGLSEQLPRPSSSADAPKPKSSKPGLWRRLFRKDPPSYSD